MISIVSNSSYGMPRGQIHINLPPEHPIMSFETIEIKMAAVSAKRSIEVTELEIVYSLLDDEFQPSIIFEIVIPVLMTYNLCY